MTLEELTLYIENKEKDWDECQRQSQSLHERWGQVERELNAAREKLDGMLEAMPESELKELDDAMNAGS